MHRILKPLRKIALTAIGLPLVVLGIILIPLPGPGLVICAAGLYLLSLEFAWARKYFGVAKRAFMKIIDSATDRADKLTDRLFKESKS